MSEGNVNRDRINPKLSELESALGALVPAETVDRDELLFEAGRRAALPRGRNETRLWKSLAAALAVMLAGQTLLFWPVVDESGGDSIAGRGGDEKPVDEPGSDGISTIVPVFPAEPAANSVTSRRDEASRGGAHARRVYSEHGIGRSAPISAESVQNKQPLVAQYLRLRRLALTEGVEAVDLQPSEKEQSPVKSGATRREILRELLGS